MIALHTNTKRHLRLIFDNTVFTNGTVNLQCGTKQIKYNNRRIKPYKSDTKIDNISSKICLKMSAYDSQLYNFGLTSKDR